MKALNDLACGKAGEYLVCADLILRGYVAFPSEQGLPFDVICDTGCRLLKVQVKTTRKPIPVPQRVKRTDKYCFNVRRCGKGGRRSYQDGDVDLFALVALDSKAIGYLPAVDVAQTMFFLPEGKEPLKGKYAAKSSIRNLSSYDFDIACRRIEQAYAQPRLFEDKQSSGAVQGELLTDNGEIIS